jgi:prepilin-type N-terminal cleavage/methylation domain-containing protein
MSFANIFGFKSDAEVAGKLAAIEPKHVGGKLGRKLQALKKKQGGFTLLELLVVVAILAAVAGTATIILRDTDRKASAAAHVAMMDELSKGMQTFRLLNEGKFPDVYDSLMARAANNLTGATAADFSAVVNGDLLSNLVVSPALTVDQVAQLDKFGFTQLRIINNAADPNTAAGTGDCSNANIRALINDTGTSGEDVTNANIFRVGIGCGFATNYSIAAGDVLPIWDTSVQANADRIKMPLNARVYAFGIGPDSSLFDPQKRGALSNVPTYRHVAQDEYNRFVGLFGVNTTNADIELVAVVDGAGDTKDEELGEWDNTRSTL